MKSILIILGYLKWHYGKAVISLSKIWKNFLFFMAEFFSLRLLFHNFFDPWKRMSDNYPKSFNLKKYFYAFLTNLIVRIIGIIMRTLLIIIGLLSLFGLILIYPLAIIIWLILPLIIAALLSTGLTLIISL